MSTPSVGVARGQAFGQLFRGGRLALADQDASQAGADPTGTPSTAPIVGRAESVVHSMFIAMSSFWS